MSSVLGIDSIGQLVDVFLEMLEMLEMNWVKRVKRVKRIEVNEKVVRSRTEYGVIISGT